ncbi:MAG: xanthine dehydrogenase family protein subunit M [bacterium]|nr:xanthine dehydrogenase family protein subunit M [bacterium]
MLYSKPQTLKDAVTTLGADGHRPLAGGSDLLVRLGREAAWPDGLVDIKAIPELKGMKSSSRGLRLGAALRLSELACAPEVAAYPALVEVCRVFAARQVCERATIGGNLANASPAADTVPSLIVYGAECRTDRRSFPVEELAVGPGQTILADDEIITAVMLPTPAPQTLSFYRKLATRDKMAIAIAGVAVHLEMQGGSIARARVALGSVAPTVIRAHDAEKILTDGGLTAKSIALAARAAAACARPITDIRATAEYRRTMCARLLEYHLTRLANLSHP